MKPQPQVPQEVREAIFIEIIHELWKYDTEGAKDIAERAGCHWVTLFAWKSGRTNSPRIDKLAPVARVLGYEIVLNKTTAWGKKTIRPLRRVK